MYTSAYNYTKQHRRTLLMNSACRRISCSPRRRLRSAPSSSLHGRPPYAFVDHRRQSFSFSAVARPHPLCYRDSVCFSQTSELLKTHLLQRCVHSCVQFWAVGELQLRVGLNEIVSFALQQLNYRPVCCIRVVPVHRTAESHYCH